jgi:hypothetical protein
MTLIEQVLEDERLDVESEHLLSALVVGAEAGRTFSTYAANVLDHGDPRPVDQ